VFAKANIDKGEMVCEYVGKVVAGRRLLASKKDSLITLYEAGRSTTRLILDPTEKGNIARFICGTKKEKANLKAQRCFIQGSFRILLFAIAPIVKKDILYYDYNGGEATHYNLI
jgi:SET domain-containing protein